MHSNFLKNTLKNIRACSFAALMTAALAVTLNGCTSGGLEEDFDTLTPEKRVEVLTALKELEETGRVGLIAVLNGQRFSVDFNYHYKNGGYSLEFTGPMGMQYAKLDVQAHDTSYLKVRSEFYEGSSPRQLLKDNFGFDVPADDLRMIMLGLPKGDKTYDAKGYVQSCNYDDEYIVRYKQYKTFRGGYTLPTDIEMATPFSKIIIKVNNVNRIN